MTKLQSVNPNLSLSKMIFQSVVSIKRADVLSEQGRQNFFIVTKASCSLTPRSNKRGGLNKRWGWQKFSFITWKTAGWTTNFLEINKRAYPFIWDLRVLDTTDYLTGRLQTVQTTLNVSCFLFSWVETISLKVKTLRYVYLPYLVPTKDRSYVHIQISLNLKTITRELAKNLWQQNKMWYDNWTRNIRKSSLKENPSLIEYFPFFVVWGQHLQMTLQVQVKPKVILQNVIGYD